MGVAARRRAGELTWRGYGEIVARSLSALLKIETSVPASV